jgi:hypothetical protein
VRKAAQGCSPGRPIRPNLKIEPERSGSMADTIDRKYSRGKSPLDYEGVKALAAHLKVPLEGLLAQAKNNDPFFAGMPSRRGPAEWFAELWEEYKFGSGIHVRRIHYVLISQRPPVLRCDTTARYVNTVECWRELTAAARDARLLGLVPMEDFVDRRAEGVHVYLANDAMPASLTVTDADLASRSPFLRVFSWLPQHPKYEFVKAIIDQRYHVEIWIEKSGVNDVVLPIARRYGLNVLTGVGDLSLTHCHDFVQRVIASGRPARILYISDFDPQGFKMPVGAARKIEFVIRTKVLNLDVQLRPVVLTPEQVRRYRLPPIPMKDTVKGKDAFLERFGVEGATELDALEALRPGELRRILEEQIDQYYDHDLRSRVDEAADEFLERAKEARQDVIDRHRSALNKLHARQNKLAKEANAKLDPIIKRYEKRLRDVADEFNEIQETIAQEMADEAPDHDDVEWPEPEEADEDLIGAESGDALYDSKRDYLDQMEFYRKHDGKERDHEQT